MANNQNSYEFKLPLVDLSMQYEQLILSQPTILQYITIGVPCTETKTQWYEDKLSETTFTVSALGTDGDGTTFTFSSVDGLKVGDILKFYSSLKANRTGLAKVTAINTTTKVVTIARDHGGLTLATLAVNDVAHINSRPRPENSDAEVDPNRQGTTNYNYTEIIDVSYNLSNTALAISTYDSTNTLTYQQAQHMLGLIWREQNSLLHNARVERSDSENGTQGGFDYFTQGGLAETTGGAISATHINNALEKIYNASGMISNNLLLCMNTNQARRVSAFNTSGTNPIVQIADTQRTTGRFISNFIGDLPVNNGFSAPIIVDPTLPKDEIYIMDMNAIERCYLRPMGLYDATPAGRDGKTERLLAETSSRWKNAKEVHCKITGLTI